MILTCIGIFLTIVGLILTIIGTKHSRKTTKNLENISSENEHFSKQIFKLQELNRSIADYTRKPLNGIAEIFCQCYDLLRKVGREGGKFWFVGLTLGFGPPHKYRVKVIQGGTTIEIDDQIKEVWSSAPKIQNMIVNFNNMLKGVIGSTKSTIVLMKQDKAILEKKFIRQLTKRTLYQSLKGSEDAVIKEILTLNESVAEKVSSNRPIKYLESIPLQAIIAEIPSGSPPSPNKRACVVFHVGTENIGSIQLEDGEIGFYSELDSICDMFINVAESLYNQ